MWRSSIRLDVGGFTFSLYKLLELEQHYVRAEQLWNHEDPEPPQIKEEQEEPEPPQIKEDQGELCSSQEGEQLVLKQQTGTLYITAALSEEDMDLQLRLVKTIRMPEIKLHRIVEEEEDDGEDAEIDVVTLDTTSWRPDPAPLVLKPAHIIDIHLHNYAAPLTAGKRLKAVGPGGRRRCWSPRSDSEDRRRTHNVLERQRRDQLRRNFLSLRDQVPAVEGNGKVAKVLVLKEAAAFIAEVREEERSLLMMKEALTMRSRQLRQRLEWLGTSC
ncbi:myc proto-oncogene protein [Nematolebias whitei]|uniref:myc proto-oncogene protein n=1 Tax=Nematolebias whitei TaxID=451745 RepID=UPI00189A58CB|nr:myc proto-oncogene protein [Nematolebias whitei]